MNKIRTVRGLLAGIAGLALLMGGFAIASNMGFKFVPSVPGSGNAFNLSLPWNNNYTDAKSLLTDVNDGGNDINSVGMITPDSTLTEWFGIGGVNFTIRKGEAYTLVSRSDASGPITPVIVGSHDPNYSITFSYALGQNAFNAAAPYHQTFTTAKALFDDMGAANVSSVAKFDPDLTLVEWFDIGGVNFPLELGAGVVIYSKQEFTYSWPHY